MKRLFIILILGISSVSYCSILDNIQFYCRMNERTGTNINDTVNNNDGTASNCTVNQTGKLDKAILFNGSTSIITMPPYSNFQFGTGDFTITAWVNLTGADASWRGIVGGEVHGFAFGTFGNPGILYAAKVDDAGSPTSGLTVSNGAWHFVAITFNSTATTNNLIFYLDDANATVTFNYNYEGASHIIGGIKSGANPWYGLIDEVGIWKRVLTPTEIAQIYNSGNGITYPFSSHLGYKLYDASNVYYQYSGGHKYWVY
jgi:hypothetical protein